jgi:hypothetical protein
VLEEVAKRVHLLEESGYTIQYRSVDDSQDNEYNCLGEQ